MMIEVPAFSLSRAGLSLPVSGPNGPTPEAQKALLADLGTLQLDWAVFGGHLAFDADGYVRRRLFLDESWEILLLCWLPGQKTAIHDHGASWGATLVLTGDLVEAQYRWRGHGLPIEFKGEAALGAHQVTVETQDTIHTVSNQSAAPAASLHLYSPPLRYLHAYEPDTGEQRYIEPSESRFFTR